MSAFFPFKQPLVLGHRGSSARAPENTLAAFRLAFEEGADGIELDARLTRDRVVMVLHDATVERVSDGAGRMDRLIVEEISRLDAGSKFGPAFQGERIPSLEEVFQTFEDRPVYDLEIKNFDAPGNGLESKVLDLIRRFGLEKRVIITSFNPISVRFFRRELPYVPVGLLLLGGRAGRTEETLLSWWASDQMVGLNQRYFSQAFASRQKDRAMMVWGGISVEEVKSAVQIGAAGVIVDDPLMARRALGDL